MGASPDVLWPFGEENRKAGTKTLALGVRREVLREDSECPPTPSPAEALGRWCPPWKGGFGGVREGRKMLSEGDWMLCRSFLAKGVK